MTVMSANKADGLRSALVAMASQEGRLTGMRDDLGRLCLEAR